MSGEKYEVIWEPQAGPQTALLTCPVYEVFYGGARGGGKTDGMLGEWVSHADLYGERASGLLVRRTLVDLSDTIERSKQIYRPLGAEYHSQEKTWRFPDGARLRFAYLDNDADADHYQGHSYTRVYVEEIGQFPNKAPIMKLMATLRSGAGVPCCFRATGNPGGPGHHWVKTRYIDPAPLGWEIIEEEFENPFTGETAVRQRVFIPAKVTDNKKIDQNAYVASLQQVGGAELVRAWLLGDWSVISGAFFPEFTTGRHVIRPFEIPAWTRFVAMDWGSARPFSVGWYAVSDGTGDYPANALIKYREWYGGNDNVGLKLSVEAVADGIKAREERSEKIAYRVIDPACYKEDGGPSIAEQFARNGLVFRPADNQRLPGWQQLRDRLIGHDGKPMLYLFSTCLDTIRTIPALQHDEAKPEDVDTEGDDHAGDETRYACMSRPYVRPVPRAQPQRKTINELTLNELLQRQEAYEKRRARYG